MLLHTECVALEITVALDVLTCTHVQPILLYNLLLNLQLKHVHVPSDSSSQKRNAVNDGLRIFLYYDDTVSTQ